MPSGDNADPICLSSDSEGDGDMMCGMLSAAAKGKGRATDTALDVDQSVEKTTAENQTAYTGGADVSVTGTRALTPGKPSSVGVRGVLPQSLQSSPNRNELHQYSSTSLRDQQAIGRNSQLSPVPDPAHEILASPLGKHVWTYLSPCQGTAQIDVYNSSSTARGSHILRSEIAWDQCVSQIHGCFAEGLTIPHTNWNLEPQFPYLSCPIEP
jgi:hypothetical protein